jgi:hypothetical protein
MMDEWGNVRFLFITFYFSLVLQICAYPLEHDGLALWNHERMMAYECFFLPRDTGFSIAGGVRAAIFNQFESTIELLHPLL